MPSLGPRSDEPAAAMAPGAVLGRYVIIETLGRGGMGVVYRAHDPELDREVAVKLLRERSPDARAAGAERQRLAREAKTMARLSHPHVVAVYDVGTQGDHVFVAMELVEGTTLRGWLEAPRTWREIVAMFCAAGRGLAAAHEAGIVHRDFKPDNVLVGKDGRPRVADFGLALPVASAGVEASSSPLRRAPRGSWRSSSVLMSATGAVFVGTPRYMSPEQLSGEAAGMATDQFAFCVSLWEALYREPPFDAPDLLNLLREIHDAHFRTQHANDVPRWLRQVLVRGLAAVPGERYSSMTALIDALEHDPGALRRRWLLGAGAVAAAFLAVAAGAALSRSRRDGVDDLATRARPPEESLRPVHPSRITFDDGCDESPAFTPDGRGLVFDASRGQDSVIVEKSLVDGAVRRLTDVRGWDIAPAVSPDGKLVAFLRIVGAQRATFVVDRDGTGPPRRLVEGGNRPTFSFDGTAVWGGDGARLVRVDTATGHETRVLPNPAGRSNASGDPFLREVADGRMVLLFPGDRGDVTGVAIVTAGSVEWLTADPLGPASAAPPGTMWREEFEEAMAVTHDGSRVLLSHITEAGNTDLLALPLGGGEPTHVLGNDLIVRTGLAVSPDGTKLAWSTCHDQQSLVRISAGGGVVPFHDFQPWREAAVAEIPGSRRLVLLAERDGMMVPWVIDRDGKDPPRKLEVPGIVEDMALSPDGALAAVQLGAGGIGVVPVAGGPLRRLTEGVADGQPRFTRDGQSLVFTRQPREGIPQLFSVPLGGGAPRPLLEPGTSQGVPSPTREVFAYLAGAAADGWTVFLFDPTTGARRRLSERLPPGTGMNRGLAFSPDGERLSVFLGSHLVELNAKTGAVLRSADSGNGQFTSVSYVDGEPVGARFRWEGDLWMADLRP